MKKKLFSMVLVLVMIVCAVPCTFGTSAAEASDWTPVNFDYIENTADGFTIPANGARASKSPAAIFVSVRIKSSP